MKETTQPNTERGDGGDCLERVVSRDELIGGIGVLREAVEKLLEVNHLKDTSDAELECHAHRGWSPEIQDECENVLLARNALRMTRCLPG